MSRPIVPTFLPTAAQSLLLTACLAGDDEARDAWQRWQATIDLDTLDLGSIRLLPMLATRLTALGVTDPRFATYRGVQRRSWATNQILLRKASEVAAMFASEAIVTVALKGLALAGPYYHDASLRPMSDVDLLVQRDRAVDAVALLEAAGWTATHNRPRVAADLAVHHAAAFVHPATRELALDLHWRLLPARFSDAGDAAMWRSTVPLAADPALRAPEAADLLVHACAHGARFNGVPPIRWVVDAAMIIRSATVDWSHVEVQAIRFGVALPVAVALRYLADRFQLAVPAATIDRLTVHRSSRIERLLFDLDQQPFRQRRFVAQTAMHVHVAHATLGAMPSGYWRYARAMSGNGSTAQTLRWLTGRIGRAWRR